MSIKQSLIFQPALGETNVESGWQASSLRCKASSEDSRQDAARGEPRTQNQAASPANSGHISTLDWSQIFHLHDEGCSKM